MRETDLPAVTQIEQETYSDPWSRQMFLEHLNSISSRNMVLEAQEIIGFSCTTLILHEIMSIDNLTIKSDRRKQGLGSLLLGQIIKDGKDWRIVNFTLEVRESNQAAIRLYSKFSFRCAGRRKNYYHRPTEDALIMTLEEKNG
jgi:ribosomal-protein-alanine N-acetyltransferase